MSSREIIYLTGSMSRRAGGLFESVRYLSQSLHLTGSYRLRVLSLRDDYSDDDRGSWRDVPVETFQTFGPRAFGYAPAMNVALRSSQAQLLHVHGIWMYPSVVSSRWARIRRPYIVSPRGMLDGWALRNSRWKKRLAAILYEDHHLRGAACLHALNAQEADAFRAYGLKNPICVIANGVERVPSSKGEMAPAWAGRIPAEGRVLFFLGRIHPKKGIEPLLRAWSAVSNLAKSSAWSLAIGGWDDGGHEGHLRSLTAELSLEDQVVFVGPQFGRAKAACLKSASAFVLPSYSEGMPMAVLEAWSYGLPVLMTRFCNIPEGFASGAAVQIEPNEESIAVGLRQLFTAPPENLRQIGQRGLALVERRFLWSSIASRMKTVYDWTLGQSPRPDFVLT